MAFPVAIEQRPRNYSNTRNSSCELFCRDWKLMSHIALAGATGYVGTEFAKQIQQRGHRLSIVGRSDCNLLDLSSTTKYLESLTPDFLINCAGYTGKPNVDACESDKTNCLAGNAILPGVLSKACQAVGIHWGHVSSGCIFTGTLPSGAGFGEFDPPNFSFRQNNCSFYSGTKALVKRSSPTISSVTFGV